MKRPSGPVAPALKRSMKERVSGTWLVASSGTISSGTLESKTALAAGGSMKMFHSATVLGLLSVKPWTRMLPGTSTAPPIATMRRIFLASLGSSIRTSAMFDIAPSERIETGLRELRSVFFISSTELRCLKRPFAAGTGIPSRPSVWSRHWVG